MTDYGYAGVILKVDLSRGSIEKIPSSQYIDRFLGGRGMASRLYWDIVPAKTGAFDPENCLIYVTGPITGFTRVSGGNRWQVCGKSPVMNPEAFSYANLGERWGVRLKSAGYDGLIVQGKANKPVYFYIDNEKTEIRDATTLRGKTTYQVFDILKAELGKDTSIITIGPAAENLVSFATMLTDDGSSGASGLGSVMGSKNLKAVAVAGNQRPQAADPDGLYKLTDRIIELRRDTWKNWLDEMPGVARRRACYGCPSGCFRKSYMSGDRRLKFFCQAMHVYRGSAERYGGDTDKATLLAIQLCDQYGLDTTVMQPLIEWLAMCYQEGVINDEDTGLPVSKIGSIEFIEAFVYKLSYREGFGDLLSKGAAITAAKVGKRAEELLHAHVITRANETRDYDPRLILTNAMLYATEPRRPINQLHETSHSLWLWRNWKTNHPDGFLTYNDFVNIGKNFWGGEAASDYSVYEGKALASKKIQDRTYAKESLILCDFLWPIIWVRFADDHTGDPTMESRLLSTVTGKEIDEAGLNEIGERIFNLQRAIFLRDGWKGREDDTLLDYIHEEPLPFVFFNPDCIVPAKGDKVVSRKGATLPREDFENLKSEYYELRGWDVPSGLLTEKKLGELGLSDIAADLKTKNLCIG